MKNVHYSVQLIQQGPNLSEWIITDFRATECVMNEMSPVETLESGFPISFENAKNTSKHLQRVFAEVLKMLSGWSTGASWCHM